MTEYDKLIRLTRWCSWMVHPCLTFSKVARPWSPYWFHMAPLRLYAQLLRLHLVALRMYAGYGDA
jgi:hypothetical protein